MLFRAHRVILVGRIIAFPLVHNSKEGVLLIGINLLKTRNSVLTASNQETRRMRVHLSSLVVSAR